MWPQALQMTRDECRGILRRLELESYSHVISVFRAQGGLSDNKTKLLEELRGIFHISQERHRAEARRVANDEQLCTIAEAISGPNTWQEWSREGRRSYPMLPRVAPQTALALIANNVATETASENAKLPYPADTAAQAAAEHANTVNAISGQESAAPWEIKREVYVVTDDPFKMPDIPVGNKKSLKRNISDSHTGINKKRIVSDSSPSKQQQQKQFHHITANSAQATSPSSGASNIRKLYHNHNSKTIQNRLNQQQLQKPKLAMKKSAVTAGASITSPLTPGKRQATPAKSGRKSNSKIQEQKQQHILQQQQVLAQSQQQLQSQTVVRHVPHVVGERADELNNEQRYAQPQIAASKKDITKNLTKLQLPSVITSPTTATASAVSPTAIAPPMALSSPLAVSAASARIDAHQISTVISPVASGGMSVSIPAMPHNKVDKQLISTPVQKIILEDRLPPPQPPGSLNSAATPLASAVVSTASTLQIQSTSTSQIMTLPQISAAATKLRAINTTILPPGTKLTTKKLSSSTLINASSIGTHGNENNNEGNSNSSNTLTAPAVPTHTPPAIIQIQSTNSGSMTNEGTATIATPTLQSAPQPAQGKVLTTKLLPIVLSGTGAMAGSGSAAATLSGGVNAGNTVNITKIETLNNGATLVSAASGVGGNNPNASLSGTTAMIKNMGSTLLLSPNQSSSTAGSALFSTLTSGASVFRKSQIIKTGTIGVNSGSAGKLSGTFNTSNSGPQIISNIKLTPAITTSVTSVSHSNQHHQSTTSSSFLQHQLKNISTTGIRTSVKICQSPNGKVFIQSANVDGASKGKLQGAFSHKILPNAVVSSSAAGAGTSVTHQPQRIAIQKVQIIPAPLNSPGNLTSPFHTATTQSHSQSKPSTTTNTITLSGNKSNMNMVFVPSVGGRTTSGTITLSKSANVGSGIVASKVQQSSQNPDAAKPNVVIIGSSPAQSGSGAPIKTATFIDGNNKYNITTPVSTGSGSKMHLEPNQMITEDTPVDILNMPIIVDSGDGTNITMGNNIGDTVTVLPTSLIESAQQQQQQQQQQQPSTIILGATDWEMELDQATAVAAATKAAARTDYSRQSSGHGGKQCNSMSDSHKQQMHDKESIDGETIIIDDSFEDVIVEEQEEGDTDAGAETEGTVDGEMDEGETGEDTGGEEGQEMTEKAYTIFSGNESEGELLPPRPRDTVKLKVGQLEKTYNTITTAANSDDEPIEVIDDDDDNVAVAGNQKLFRRSQMESEKNERKLNAANVNNGSGNNNSATVECDTDAGFDETIVADIDENTAIEYIEDESSHVTHAAQMHEKIDVNDVDNISVKATKRQLVENEVIVLDDNDGAALKTTATLATAPMADSDDAMEDEVLVESDTSKGVSGSSPSTINVGAVKPAPLTVINSKNVAGLE
ncbi:BRCA2-interacting transcriptional repressor EMSY [Anastrepha obliqua]|uniref:BRCA2-interacting transcriptional repressor EMSY n=1 Tax=Anastrepha obliqua TaxID=95512 RepID=UPI00240954E8|nr:BRCA2-interacting transcriptional repressor EMSY [Anastrepha obliqua]